MVEGSLSVFKSGADVVLHVVGSDREVRRVDARAHSPASAMMHALFRHLMRRVPASE